MSREMKSIPTRFRNYFYTSKPIALPISRAQVDQYLNSLIFDVQVLLDAVRDVREGGLSIRKCSVKYKLGRKKLTK
jgi:hypothetical protein